MLCPAPKHLAEHEDGNLKSTVHSGLLPKQLSDGCMPTWSQDNRAVLLVEQMHARTVPLPLVPSGAPHSMFMPSSHCSCRSCCCLLACHQSTGAAVLHRHASRATYMRLAVCKPKATHRCVARTTQASNQMQPSCPEHDCHCFHDSIHKLEQGQAHSSHRS